MNYNIPNYPTNYYNQNDERFIGTGFVGPLLLGGVAGYAIGQNYNNGRPMVFYPNRPYYPPYPYYPYPYNFYRKK